MRRVFAAYMLVFVGLIGSLAGQSTHAAPVEIEASVDRMEMVIGDVITLRVKALYDDTVLIALPKPEKRLGDFEIYSLEIKEPLDIGGGVSSLEGKYRLWALQVGEYEIPALEIPYHFSKDSLPRIAVTPAIVVSVHSVVGELVDSAEIKPLYEPLEDPLGVSPLYEESLPIWYTAALFAVMLVAVLWFALGRGKKLAAPIDNRPAWEKALERLAALSANTYLSDGQYKEYYSELTAAYKEYLGRLFEYPALDMTTSELLAACDNDSITRPNSAALKEILGRADMVKFARALPPIEVPEKDFQRTYEMVQLIKEEYQERESQRAAALAEAQELAKKAVAKADRPKEPDNV